MVDVLFYIPSSEGSQKRNISRDLFQIRFTGHYPKI
jgi:hypothetical protein